MFGIAKPAEQPSRAAPGEEQAGGQNEKCLSVHQQRDSRHQAAQERPAAPRQVNRRDVRQHHQQIGGQRHHRGRNSERQEESEQQRRRQAFARTPQIARESPQHPAAGENEHRAGDPKRSLRCAHPTANRSARTAVAYRTRRRDTAFCRLEFGWPRRSDTLPPPRRSRCDTDARRAIPGTRAQAQVCRGRFALGITY